MNLHVNSLECDPSPGNYYVSIFDREANNGKGRLGLLLGPYPTHRQALDLVNDGRRLAERVNDRAVWWGVGTVKMPDSYSAAGVLNDLLAKEECGSHC